MSKSPPTALYEYLTAKDLSCNAFAAGLGISHTTVTRILREEMYPRRPLAKQITRATKGAVVFYPDHAPARRK